MKTRFLFLNRAFALVVILIFLSSSNCKKPKPPCDAKAMLSLGTADIKPFAGRALICPGESVILAWSAENASDVKFTAPRDSALGDRSGDITVTPSETVSYTLEASNGSCSNTSTATIQVVKPGDHYSLAFLGPLDAENNPPNYVKWFMATTDLVSPNVTVTSVRLILNGRNCTWPDWHIRKVDDDGRVHEFDIHPDPSAAISPGAFPLAGTYEALPINAPATDKKDITCSVTLEMTVSCQ